MTRFKVFALAVAPLAMLAGCGERFKIDVAAPTSTVTNQLASLDGSSAGFLGVQSFRKEVLDDGQIRYVIPAKDGYEEGEILFTVSDDGNGGSLVDVEVDLPRVRYGDKILDEDLAAVVLRGSMKKWASDVAAGESDVDQIEGVLAAITVAAQDMNAFDGGQGVLAFGDLFDGGVSDEGGGWGDGTMADASDMSTEPDSDFGQPMDDPDATFDDSFSASDDGWAAP